MDRTLQIKVVEPCECDMCQSGKRWFMCLNINTRWIADYEVTQDMVLQPEQIQHVQDLHPEMNLIY